MSVFMEKSGKITERQFFGLDTYKNRFGEKKQ